MATVKATKGNLFTLQADGVSAWAHGKAFASAQASLHRGIELGLSAGAKASGGGAAQVGPVVGTLQAALGADVSITLDLAFPLDLFKEAGLVAKLDLALEAAAYVQLDVSFESSAFQNDLKTLLPGVWGRLIDIFLDEIELEAGVAARAAFAAEIVGELMLVGSLLPQDGMGAGFTFAAQFAAGFGFGAGVHLPINFGITDGPRLLSRLSDEVTNLIENEVQQEVKRLVGQSKASDQDKVAAALPYLRLILPMASRCLFELGANLVSTDPSQHSTVASASVVSTLLSSARTFLLQKAVSFALRKADGILTAATKNVTGLSAAQQVAARNALAAAHTALDSFKANPPSSPEQWLTAAMTLIGQFDSLVSAGMVDSADLQSTAATLWAAVGLLRSCAQWESGPSKPASTYLTDAVQTPPGDGSVAAFVAAQVGGQAASLTGIDLVNFLVKEVGNDLVTTFPELADVIAWLGNLLGTKPSDTLLKFVLSDQSTIGVNSIVGRLGSALNDAIVNQIEPYLFSKVRVGSPSANPAASLITEMADPLLQSIGAVVLPGLSGLGKTPDTAPQLREALSATLLQLISRLLLGSVNVLVEAGLEDTSRAITDLTTRINNNKGIDPVVSLLMGVAGVDLLGTPLTTDDVVGILNLCNIIVDDVQKQWPTILSDVEDVVSLGLASPLGNPQLKLKKIWSTITKNPPSSVSLGTLESDVGNLLITVGETVLLALPGLLAMHFESIGLEILTGLEVAANAALTAAADAAKQLEQDLATLEADIQKLARDVEQFIGEIAGYLAKLDSDLIGLADAVVAQIKADGWALIAPLVPSWTDSLAGEVEAVYNDIFAAVQYLIDGPLALLGQVAEWVHDAVMTAVGQNTPLSSASLTSHIQNRIMSYGARDLSFPIAVFGLDLGTITFPAGSVLADIADAVIAAASGTFGSVTLSANGLSVAQQHLAAKQALQASQSSNAAAAEAISGMTTGQPLAITISSPTVSQVYAGQAELTVTISGANASFVSAALGVPSRVRMYLNGAVYPYAAENWQNPMAQADWQMSQYYGERAMQQGYRPPGKASSTPITPVDIIQFQGQLVPSSMGLVPRPVLGVSWRAQLLPNGLRQIRLPQHGLIISGSKALQVVASRQPLSMAQAVASVAEKGVASNEPVMVAPHFVAEVPAVEVAPHFVAEVPATGVAPHAVVASAAGMLRELVPNVAERIAGFQWVLSGDILTADTPILIMRPGLNTVQVVVTDGAGQHQAQASVSFFLAKS